jgi:hypothetical protein
MGEPATDPIVEIRGGAGLEEAAAISAVISYLLETEAATVAAPSTRPAQSPWLVAGLPRHVPGPLPSHTYSNVRWSDTDEAEPPE